MNRRNLLASAVGVTLPASAAAAAMPAPPPAAGGPGATPVPGFKCVDTIADLKLLLPDALHNNQFVFVKGFDAPGDGCGGLFYWLQQNLMLLAPATEMKIKSGFMQVVHPVIYQSLLQRMKNAR